MGIKRSPRGKRDEKAKQAASTAGQVAAKAGVSLRKCPELLQVEIGNAVPFCPFALVIESGIFRRWG